MRGWVFDEEEAGVREEDEVVRQVFGDVGVRGGVPREEDR